MSYKVDAYSDIGTRKNVNQDALLIKRAKVNGIGDICMGVLCDGMGGLSCGEVASSSFVDRMDVWFKHELPGLLMGQGATELLSDSTPSSGNENIDIDLALSQIETNWSSIIHDMNDRLKEYGNSNGIRLGTTVVAIIFLGEKYLAMNVGDSRAYKFNRKDLTLITHDHSFVQQQIDLGRMTEEEAWLSDKKSVLLQCIGASEVVTPEFYEGAIERNQHFLLCSDGLWRKLSAKEIIKVAPQRNGIQKLADMVMKRGESDNISGLIISA